MGRSNCSRPFLPFFTNHSRLLFPHIETTAKEAKGATANVGFSRKKVIKVVTNGGLHGTVEGLDGSILIVKIADNVKVKIEKSAIANIVGVTDKK